MKKVHLLLVSLFFCVLARAQVIDDFSDGDFTANPEWIGDVSEFEIESEQLNSNGPAATSVLHLSTANSLMNYTTWEFLIDMQFAPSGSNKVRAYLASDESDLESDLNGYFVEIGQSNADQIKLYRQDGVSTDLLFTGDSEFTGNVLIRIQVYRNASGLWSVLADPLGGTSFISEGDDFMDNTYTNTSSFGFVAFHTMSNRGKFYFDDISITAEDPPFSVESVSLQLPNSLLVTFSQDVDNSSATVASNYSVDFGYGQPTSAVIGAADEVLLTFDVAFANNEYTINMDAVQNSDTDETVTNVDLNFSVEVATAFRQIVINEIYADFNPSAAGLPDEEFLELTNVSDQAVKIEGFTINENAIDDFVVAAGSYVILTDDSNVASFSGFGDVVSVSSFPALTNGGMQLLLRDNLGNLVDSLTYDLNWYHDASKDDGGFTIEQINPERVCNYVGNWSASLHPDGGTPGQENSIYDNSPDTKRPNLIAFEAVDENTVQLSFDEPMDDSSLAGAIYSFDQGLNVDLVTPLSGFFSVTIDLVSDLVSGTTYSVSITGAIDCAGNELEVNSLSFRYDNSPPVLNQVQVTTANQIKLIFNESLDEASAEKETNFVINNSIGSPSSANIDDESGGQITLNFENEFELGLENKLTISNLSDTLGNVLVLPILATFTYELGIDTVHVISANHLRVIFRESIQNTNAINTENYSVDQNVGSPISAYQNASDESIVNLIFQSDLPDNKELTLSTQNILTADGEPLSTPNVNFVFDTSSPKIDTLIVASPNSLEVVFSEKVERISAESSEHYEYDDIYPASAQLTLDQKTVELVFADDFEPEVEYELLIDEVADLFGNTITTRLREAFVYDVFPSAVDSVYVMSPNEVVVIFNEKVSEFTAENTANYNHDPIGSPISAILDKEFLKKVVLTFGADFQESSGLPISISNIEDIRGNAMSDVILKNFNNDQLQLGSLEALDQNSIQIIFTKPVDQAEAEKPENYLLDKVHEPISVSVEGRKAVLTFDQKFTDFSTHQLGVDPIDTQVLGIATYDFLFDSKLEFALMTNLETIELTFSQKLEKNQPLDILDFEVNQEAGHPMAVVVSTENNHVLRLIFDQSFLPDTEYLVAWNSLDNEFGNSIPGFSASIFYDQEAPKIKEHQIVNENNIWLKFDEALLESSAEFLQNYAIDHGVGQPSDVSYQKNDSSVLLTFLDDFQAEVDYVLSIENVKDLTGNATSGVNLTFNYVAPYVAQFGDLIITEILPEPNEDQTEFFEIYNASQETVFLNGLTFKDGTTEATFISGEVNSGDYILLTADPDQFENPNLGGLSKWLTLNNGGETLSIFNGDQLIFSTKFDENWYQSDEKSQGGFSLEMVDVTNPCGEIHNWKGSNALGGTPGILNSVTESNPDQNPPFLLTGFVDSERTILLEFNEKISPTDNLPNKISINPLLIIDHISQNSPQNDQIKIELIEPLNSQNVYELSIVDVKDCANNWITEPTSPISVILPEEAEPQDIIINEVLFNPRSGGVDFVEIYNHSEKVIDLKGWYVADQRLDLKTITNDHLLLHPGAYLALTPDPKILAADYPNGGVENYFETNSFPSLNNDRDSVLIFNATQTTIDQMVYDEDFHFGLLADKDGVSLERVSFNASADNSDTWQSAASTVGYATPGLINSQFIESNLQSGAVTVSPKVFFPDNTGQDDFTTISYELSHAGSFANVQVFSSSGAAIKSLAQNELLSTRGFVTWDGTTESGGLAGVGYYIVYFEIYDASGNKEVYKESVALGTRF